MFKNIHLSYYFFSQEDEIMYHFDREYNRRNTECVKWDVMSEDILPMWIADMDFEAPAPIYEAFVKRANHHVYAYSKLSNEYYQAVIDFMQRRHNFHVEKDWIVFTPGVVIALTLGVQAVTEPGEEVMILSPVYGPFRGATTACGRKLIESPLVNNDGYYTIDFEDMEKRVTPNTKAFMLCSPHNPVGRVWTEDEVRNIVELCKKYSVWLFSDEIHGDVVLYGHQYTSAARFADVYDHMLVYTAISKTFNMAGLHSSCTIIPNPEYKKIQEDTLRQAWLMSPNCMANSAIEACYTYGDEWVDEQNAYLTENAEFVTSYLKEHAPQIKPVKPEGTYLMWLDCSELSMTSEEIVKILASEYKMAVGGGAGYQGNGEYFLRFNIGCPRETLEKGMEILAQFVADKKGV